MGKIAEELLNDSRQAILAEHSAKVEKDSWQAKDLLSVLLKANMATDLQPHQRMSDEDVLARKSYAAPTAIWKIDQFDQRYQLS